MLVFFLRTTGTLIFLGCLFFRRKKTHSQIVGLESYPTKTPVQPRQILYAHMDALRRQPFFHGCRFMIIPEANLGDQAQLLAQVSLRRYRDVDVLCEKSHCYGVFTKPGDPERYVNAMRNKLAEDGLFFHDKVVCVNPFQTNMSAKQKLEAVMKEFKRQLFSFRMIHLVPKGLGSRVKVVYTGKADKDNQRTNRTKDDLCMALLFGYFNYTRYTSNHNLVNKRDSYSMLRLEMIGGTVLEGGREAAVPDRGENDVRDVTMRQQKRRRTRE